VYVSTWKVDGDLDGIIGSRGARGNLEDIQVLSIYTEPGNLYIFM
jgi:hypothetical protein